MSVALLEPIVALLAAIALWAVRSHLGQGARRSWLAVVAVAGANALLGAFVTDTAAWPVRAALVVAAAVTALLVARGVMQSLEFRARRAVRIQRIVALLGSAAVAMVAAPADGDAALTTVLRTLLVAGTGTWATLELFAASRAGSGRRLLGWGMLLMAASETVGAAQLTLAPGSTPWAAALTGALALALVVSGVHLDASDRERAQAPEQARAVARAEADVARTRAEIAAAFEISTDALHMVDQHLRLVACNETFRSRVLLLTGRAPDIGEPVEQCYPPSERAAWEARYHGALAGKTTKLDVVIDDRPGRSRIEAVSLAPVRHGSRIVGAVACGRDATEVRRLAEKLHANAADFRALQANAMDLVLRVGADGAVLYASPSCERLFGWRADELAGRSVLMFVVDGDVEDVRRLLHASRQGPPSPRPIRFRLRHREGGLRTLEGVCTAGLTASGDPSVVINARDMTDRDALEAELRRRQRGASVGRLVTGIAHDFNNLLTTVLANASLARERDPRATDLAEIVIAAERGRGLVRGLQAFTGPSSGEPSVFVPGERLAEVDAMLQRFVGANVRLAVRLDGSDWAVQMDAVQFDQLLVNIAAAESAAMPRGGALTVEASTLTVGVALRGEGPPVPAGDYVAVTVTGSATVTGSRESSPAAHDDVAAALDVARQIVERARGILWTATGGNRGTTYTVYLPRHLDAGGGAALEEPPADAPGGTETILIAEDDPSARAVAERILTGKGYTVLAAANGEEALAQARAFVGPIHLMLTDLVMPRIDGVQAARQLRLRRGDTRIVLMSGYSAALARRSEISDLGAGFIAKPFTAGALLTAVRDALDRAPASLRPLSRSGRA